MFAEKSQTRNLRKTLHQILGLRHTFEFEVVGEGAVRYLSLTALSRVTMLGNIGARPGMKLSIQINLFSTQFRSWLLQTDIIKTVCRRMTEPDHYQNLDLMFSFSSPKFKGIISTSLSQHKLARPIFSIKSISNRLPTPAM